MLDFHDFGNQFLIDEFVMEVQLISLIGMILPFVWSPIRPKGFKNKVYFDTALIQVGFLLILFSHTTAQYISIFLISYAISYLLPFLIKVFYLESKLVK